MAHKGDIGDHLAAGGNILAHQAADMGSKGLEKLNSYVQRGPAGVSVLAFFGGIFTAAVGIMGVARFDITHPFLLAMYVYMIMFGCIAFLLDGYR